MIAQVPLVDGITVEVHGYAVFWTRVEVEVVWTDDGDSEYHCWVQASQVRRQQPTSGTATIFRAAGGRCATETFGTVAQRP